MPIEGYALYSGGQGIPKALIEIFEVVEEVDYGLEYSQAVRAVAINRGLSTPTTVADKCTRKIGVTARGFEELLRDRPRLIAHLCTRFPDHKDEIERKLARSSCR